MKSKIKFLSLSIIVVLMFSIFGTYYLFSNIKTSSAKNSSIYHTKLLFHRGKQPKYIVINNVAQTIENASKNNFLNTFFTGTMNDMSTSPVVAFGYLGSLFNNLPNRLKKVAIKKIFTGGMYYSSTKYGFSLLFETNRFGKKLISRLKTKIRNKKFFYGQYEQWVVLASNSFILKEQLKILEKKEYYGNEINYSSKQLKGILIQWKPYQEKKKTYEHDFFLGLYRALFPKEFFKELKVQITFSKKGIHIIADNYFNQSMKASRLKNNLEKENKKQLKYLPYINKKHPFLLELVSNISLLRSYSKGINVAKQSPITNSTLVSISGLMNDSGILLPEISISYKKDVDDEDQNPISSFFANAFFNRKYQKVVKKNRTQIWYPKYYYYRSKKKYYKFSPVLDTLQNKKIWASNGRAYYDLKNIIDDEKNKKRYSLTVYNHLKNKFRSKQIIGGLYANIGSVLREIHSGIKKKYPVYYVEAFKDFKETLPEYISKLKSSNMVGVIVFDKKSIVTEIDISL